MQKSYSNLSCRKTRNSQFMVTANIDSLANMTTHTYDKHGKADATSLPTSSRSNSPDPSKKSWYQHFVSLLGFNKSYNVPLFIIFAGIMFLFCVANLPSLDVGGHWSKRAAPGEWYWFKEGYYRIGITIHLCSVIPAGILAVWQFIPAIRHKAILFHRINGYIVVTLVLLGNISGLMIARRSFGGDLSTQAGVGVLAILTTTGMALAWINIKRLQIEQHRAWMLRTWVYLGTIITMRVIMIIAAQILTKIGSYHILMTCGELFSIRDTTYVLEKYPSCMAVNASTSAIQNTINVPVLVEFGSNMEEIAASMRLPFGMSLWIALIIHVVAVEVYLQLTPHEAERLRRVSYKRQLEAGFKNPGSAGLLVEKFGDAEPWEAK